MRMLPSGDRAVLAEFGSLDATMAAYLQLRERPHVGVVELIPAARTVLVVMDPTQVSLTATRHWIQTTTSDSTLASSPNATASAVTIPVRYDGPDLEATAAGLGMTVDDLVRAHSGADWRCAFIGFAPGFAYLAAHDLDLGVPRLATSRERVPAGSVALAGEFTGIYPRESAGGWQLIGTTSARLWDLARENPALVVPGAAVRFEVIAG